MSIAASVHIGRIIGLCDRLSWPSRRHFTRNSMPVASSVHKVREVSAHCGLLSSHDTMDERFRSKVYIYTFIRDLIMKNYRAEICLRK
jgi:hypothetical protein